MVVAAVEAAVGEGTEAVKTGKSKTYVQRKPTLATNKAIPSGQTRGGTPVFQAIGDRKWLVAPVCLAGGGGVQTVYFFGFYRLASGHTLGRSGPVLASAPAVHPILLGGYVWGDPPASFAPYSNGRGKKRTFQIHRSI